MQPGVKRGVIATIFAGFVGTVELVWSKVLKDLGLPYFRVMGSSALLASLMFGLGARISGAKFPELSQAMWALMRAVFGTMTFLTMIVAVQIGAQPGDIAALTSINIVGAALMGHLFLKEKLRFVHVTALLLSVSGAVFISKPEVIFGKSDSGTSSWVGNLLSLVSGFCISCVFICARKSADLSMAHMCCYTTAVAALLCFLLPITPLIEDAPLSVALASPWTLPGLVGVTLALILLAVASDTAGSVLCPAAVSATMRTASSMVCGYVAQTVLFDMVPDLLTIVGAVLMLVAVVVMASVRVSQQPMHSESTETDQQVEHATDDTTSTSSIDTAAESLASFVASEFAEYEPHVAPRLRRPATSARPVARAIGLVSTVAATAV